MLLNYTIKRILSKNITFFHVVKLQNIIRILHEESSIETGFTDKIFTLVKQVFLCILERINRLTLFDHIDQFNHVFSLSNKCSDSDCLFIFSKHERHLLLTISCIKFVLVDMLRNENCKQILKSFPDIWFVFYQKLPAHFVRKIQNSFKILYFVQPFKHINSFNVVNSALHSQFGNRVKDVVAHIWSEKMSIVFFKLVHKCLIFNFLQESNINILLRLSSKKE